MNYKWQDYFPSGKTPRKQQIKGIQFALKTFLQEDKKYCILQLPTGVGKSYISTTLADYFNSLNGYSKSYILTTQIILQNQLKRQFSHISNIYSRSNYKCKVSTKATCGEMQYLHKFNGLPKCSDCPYEEELFNFINNHSSITNLSFFIKNIQFNSDIIKKRKLLIIDQAHNVQETITQHVGVDIPFKYLSNQFGMKQDFWIDKDKQSAKDIYVWLYNNLRLWLTDKKDNYAQILQRADNSLSQVKLIDLSKKYDYIFSLYNQLNEFFQVYNQDRWVMENLQNLVSLKPLYPFDYTERLLFSKGQKILLMSGTIIDKKIYCNTLGIDQSDCSFLSLDSPFPIQNRKVFFLNSGSMSRKNMENSLPLVVQDIKKIMKLHQNDKGIIHVSSHYIAQKITEILKDQRLLIVDDFQNNRNMMLQHHFETKDNTVLISPSLMEGVDLKDQLSRFQIIAKIPFPNLASNYIRIKKDKIKDWYSYRTVKSILQSYGRSIRSTDDYAFTYILDSDFGFLYKFNGKMFPKYFKNALTKIKI